MSQPSCGIPVPSRFEWLDAWRGLAVLWMIQTHCFNAFLTAEWKVLPWYHFLNYTNGLVAPSFLFIAGFVQGHAIQRVWDRGELWQITRTRIQRLVVIFSLGYLLRVTILFSAIGKASFGEIFVEWLCTVDILSCLGASLACLILIARISGNRRNFDWVVSLLVGGCLLISPFANAWTHENPFVQLFLTWTNRNFGALFPLFPWFGFAALGAVFSRWRAHARVFFFGAIIAYIGSLFLPEMGKNAGSVEPAFFMSRLSWVLLIGAGFARWAILSSGKGLLFVGKKSLLFYIVHLQIIYSILIQLPWLRQMTAAHAVIVALILTLAGTFAFAWLSKYFSLIIPRRFA